MKKPERKTQTKTAKTTNLEEKKTEMEVHEEVERLEQQIET